MINRSRTQTENWNFEIFEYRALASRLRERKHRERMRKADNWNDKWRGKRRDMHSLRSPRGSRTRARTGVFYLFACFRAICFPSRALFFFPGSARESGLAASSHPVVSPRGHRPVTQVERHLTGNEIRPGERARRADRKERVENKAVGVLSAGRTHTDSLLLLFFFLFLFRIHSDC